MGASGFVGSHVTRKLVERGDDVRVYLRKSSSTVAIDTIAPSATIHATLVKPVSSRARASGSATPSSVYGTMPVMMMPTTT